MVSGLVRRGCVSALLATSLGGFPAASLAEPSTPNCPFPDASIGGLVNAHTRFVESHLYPAIVEQGAKPFTLEDRMRAYAVPGISVAVIHDGKLAWARGWGVRNSSTCAPVTPDTAFQAASISKVVTAILALRMVEQGKLNLDADINTALKSWQLPSSPAQAGKPVTLRELLSHTAGLNVHGFAGYVPGAQIPSVVDILNGAPPANSEAVRVAMEPGKQWQYSGGGYVIAQLAMSDATGTPFATLAQRQIFVPLGMRHSAFAQLPSRALKADLSLAHNDGKVIDGGYHLYPELGPAALWTTPSDLSRVLLDVQASAKGRASKLLSPKMTATMLTPVLGNWGLGPELSGKDADRRFGHDGVNEGFQSTMVAFVEKGEGVIVMTNGNGKRLADEVVRAVATDYDWPDLASKPTVEASIAPQVLTRMAGKYEGSGMSVYLDLRDGHLFAQTGGPQPERLIALSPTRFKTEGSGMVIEFSRKPDGSLGGFTIVEGGPPVTFNPVVAEAPKDVFASPLFVRGTMNGWGTNAAFTKQADGSLSVDMPLSPGEYQFKVGAAEWSNADFGGVGTAPLNSDSGPVSLVPRGGNVRLVVSSPGLYNFILRPNGTSALLTIKRVGETH